jgi:hypothetical protein
MLDLSFIAICVGRLVPEYAIRTNAQILQDEPYAIFVVLVVQAECTRAQSSNEVACEHACWLMGSAQRLLLM